MNLINDLIGGSWSQKAAKSANFDLADLARNQHINYLSEFNELYEWLTPKYHWSDLDYLAWEEDLKKNPRLTIECLGALKRSWSRGGYGVIEELDWREL